MSKSTPIVPTSPGRQLADDIKAAQKTHRRQHDEMVRDFRLEDAHRQTPAVRTPTTVASPRERRDNGARTAGRGGDSGDDDPGEPEPPPGGFDLSFVDRAPLLWRLRALRCRLLELREGVVE